MIPGVLTFTGFVPDVAIWVPALLNQVRPVKSINLEVRRYWSEGLSQIIRVKIHGVVVRKSGATAGDRPILLSPCASYICSVAVVCKT
jgi:hypothetical protein